MVEFSPYYQVFCPMLQNRADPKEQFTMVHMDFKHLLYMLYDHF